MNQALFDQVDQYIVGQLIPRDEVLEAALRDSAAAGLRPISVAPNQGKLLGILARMVGARRILEVGTLGGYSTLWLGAALPADGALITLELEERSAEVARRNLARAQLPCSIEVRVGPALASLPALAAEGQAPFDLIFIDADKENIPAYFDWALRLARKGAVIVVDNVVRRGNILDAASADANIQGVRRFYEQLAREPRVVATAVQTVGSKGHDGFAIALVVA